MWYLISDYCDYSIFIISIPNIPAGHDVLKSLLRQNDVATLFWRNNDFIIASCARWDCFAM